MDLSIKNACEVWDNLPLIKCSFKVINLKTIDFLDKQKMGNMYLNKDKGHHQLPSVDSIISSAQSTTSGQMTQSPDNSKTNISRH